MQNHAFDETLKQIEHYKKYPQMMPFIGDNYVSLSHRKLLLIGESNYFPKKAESHHSAEAWYLNSYKELTDEEMRWINCRDLLTGKWESPGHFIYRELNRCIEEILEINSLVKGITHVAYMNGFQRPANTGDSIKKILKEVDITIGYEAIRNTILAIDPDIVVFVSKFTGQCFKRKVSNDFKAIKCHTVCHPGTGGLYWHNQNYANGRKKFISILKDEFNLVGVISS
ncbi:MAG: hypothetical protein PHI11_08610 [Gallionella sp.]|nr:hypothetical protein [Gallionella sp.]